MQEIFDTLGLAPDHHVTGRARWASVFSVTDLAVSAFGAVGLALADLIVARGWSATAPRVTVDSRLASLWFDVTLRPDGWEMPPIWDAVAGDYATADGWIRLHTNLPHHRAAALAVLGCEGTREAVARAVKDHEAEALETAVVDAGGVAAAMRSLADWQAHPQGRALAKDPLVAFDAPSPVTMRTWPGSAARPLRGLRVLDLTRVIAGPVATRLLAGLGAEVLRIDPPGWDEGNVVPDVTRGKRCARLDLRADADRARFVDLLAQADMLVHGYRADALEGLELGRAMRRAVQPNLLEVCLDAYGWTGPWATRRGFDSLVQMSTGIADAGRRGAGGKPRPLPVQALDHATGCLMAATALRLLRDAGQGPAPQQARLSLARTAALLAACPQTADPKRDIVTGIADTDLDPAHEETAWGPARRLMPPVTIDGAPLFWDRPARALGSATAVWPD